MNIGEILVVVGGLVVVSAGAFFLIALFLYGPTYKEWREEVVEYFKNRRERSIARKR